MNTPSVTPAQILAGVIFLLGQLAAFGLVDDEQKAQILSVVTTAMPVIVVVADALIRRARAFAIGQGAVVSDGRLTPPK